MRDVYNLEAQILEAKKRIDSKQKISPRTEVRQNVLSGYWTEV